MLVKILFQKSKHILLDRLKYSNIFNYWSMILTQTLTNEKAFLFSYCRGLLYQQSIFTMGYGIPTKAKWTCFHLTGVSELFPKVEKVSPLFLFILLLLLSIDLLLIGG